MFFHRDIAIIFRWTLFSAVLVGANGTKALAQGPDAPSNGLDVTTIPTVDPNRLPSTGPYSIVFTVSNSSGGTLAPDFTCAVTGPVTCGTVTPSFASIPNNGSVNVTVTYSTTSSTGNGSVTLNADTEGPILHSAGIRQMAVFLAGKGVPFFLNPNVSNIDRGLCLTVGAGEAAGLSCGDLFVVHGMPAYRTLGRDRSLTLYYNSAAAIGQVLIPARVMEPNTIAMPTTVRMIVDILGQKDSTSFSPPPYPSKCNFFPGCTYADSFQVALGRNLSGLPTGYYPVTLTVRNIYPASVQDSVVTGKILIVNRSASEYGAGWSLLGVERVLTDSINGDSTRRLWEAGDGSIRVFYRGAGVTSGQLSQSGLTSFSATNSVDNNLSNTAWTTSSSTSTSAYVRADLGATFPQAVTSARLYAGTDSNAVYDVQSSDNGTIWATVRAGFQPVGIGWSNVAWVSGGAHRYWRLKVANNKGFSSTIRELSFGSSNNFYGAPGDSPDSLVRFTNGGATWYRRNLKHGAKVELDQAGFHRTTTNRVGAVTTFTWSGASPNRLVSITVPPNSTPSRIYSLFWNGGTNLLDSIVDPAGRHLIAAMSSGKLIRLTDADTQSTRFVYSGTRLAKRIYPRKGMLGDSAYTTFTYANSARVTSFGIQADTNGSQFATTVVTQWDEKGLAALNLVDTAGLPTRVDGPLSGTGDASDLWVDGLGSVKRITNLGLNTTTTIWHDSLSIPGLVTKMQYPHPTTPGAGGQIVTQSWNGRANLVMTQSVTSHLGSIGLGTRITTWKYGDAASPDSPTEVSDSLGAAGRTSRYAYTSLGLTDSIIDPRGHRTRFTYITTGANTGLVRSLIERNVETWHESTASEVVEDQVQRFDYDANGNTQADTAPSGVVTSYVSDGLGQVTDVYDPLRTRTHYTYDAMNRLTQRLIYTSPVDHPNGVQPLQPCLTNQVVCGDSTWNFNPGLPATLPTNYVYTTSGALDSLLDPRNVKRRFLYDARGRAIRERDEFGYDRVVFINLAGMADSVRLRSSSVVKFRYDNVGRRTAVLWPSRAYADTVVAADSVVYTYDLLGRILTSLNSRGTIIRSYYADGSLRSRKNALEGFTDSLYIHYDAAGSRDTLIANGRDTVHYGYSTTTGTLDTILARLDTVGAAGASRLFLFKYDSLGRRRQVTYPSSADGQIIARFYYDAAGVLRKLSSTNTADPGGSDRFDFDYRALQVDPVGRILGQKTTCWERSAADTLNLPCGATGTRTVTNRYNRRGELVYQQDNLHVDSLRYDESGNLVHRYQSDGGYPLQTSMILLANSNRLAQDSSWALNSKVNHYYDRDGADTLQRPVVSNGSTWPLWRWQFMDGLGRLVGYETGTWDSQHGIMVWQVRGSVCRYDPDGQMYKPCLQTAPQLAYDGYNVSSTSDYWRFVGGPAVDDPLLGRYETVAGGLWTRQLYFITDGNGRQFAVGGQKGDLTGTDFGYGADRWRFTGGTTNSFSFNVDRFTNTELPGISFFRNRAYDSRTGRWTQEDPIGVAGGTNLYQFNGNNPIMFTDPFGLLGCKDPKDALCRLAEGVTNHGGAELSRVVSKAWAVESAFIPFGGGGAIQSLELGTPLIARASTIQAAVGVARVGRTTTAVASAVTEEGNAVRLVASSEGRLRAGQLAALESGEIAAVGARGVHAEVNAINYAQSLGWKVTAVAASRPICSSCASLIESVGAILASPPK